MEIKVRKVLHYKEVVINEGLSSINLGLLSAQECQDLASQLREAADDLNPQEVKD